MKIILHITTYKEWEHARSQPVYLPAEFERDGFIHCSSVAQVLNVANRFYAGQEDLLLVCIEPRRVTSPIKHEPPIHPDGSGPSLSDTLDLYPHIYGPLNFDAVIMVVEFPPNPDGSFSMPRMVEDII